MKSSGMIPVFYHADIEVAKSVLMPAIEACACLSLQSWRQCLDVFNALLSHVEQYPDMLLGIGTIMDGVTAQKFIDAGTLIVSHFEPKWAWCARK